MPGLIIQNKIKLPSTTRVRRVLFLGFMLGGRSQILGMIQQVLQSLIQSSSEQRITFAEFMALVLYHPEYGYYNSKKTKIGKQGDFFTSSSLGKDLGELIALQIVEMGDILNSDQGFTLVEMGAGVGDFAIDLLSYLEKQFPAFFESITYLIIEESLSLKQQQRSRLQALPNLLKKVQWKTWSEIGDRSWVGCCFSNELVDAFPVHRIVLNNGQWQEVYVELEEGEFKECLGELSTSRLQDYFDLIGLEINPKIYPEDYCTEVNLKALDWLETVAQKLDRGYVLTIDYGYLAHKYYHPQRAQGTLQCYYQHRHHNNPYINLGQQDITAHVDFTALENYGRQWGLEKLGFTQQGMFLMALGLGDRLAELSTGNFSIPEVLQRRDALHQLIDPMGLGGFGVLVQAKGLTEAQKLRSLSGLSSGLRV